MKDPSIYGFILFALLAVVAFVLNFRRGQPPEKRVRFSPKALKESLQILAASTVTAFKSLGRVGLTAAMVFFCMLVTFTASGQIDSLANVDWSTTEGIIGAAPYLYAVLVMIGGYLSAKIPFFRSITDTTYRVAALALAILIVFLLMGYGEFLALIKSYAFVTSIYELFISRIAKSPKPEEEPPQGI